MVVLGISAFYHDSAAAVVENGIIRAAAQEERFTRKKHDAGFPANAVRWCLTHNGISGADIDYVASYDKPFLTFERLLETYLAFAPRGFKSFNKAMPLWISEKIFQKKLLLKQLGAVDSRLADPERLLFAEHHFSHAASSLAV
jgi:carbamoyltransferase